MLKKINNKLERIFDDNTFQLHEIENKNQNSKKETMILDDISLLENLSFIFSSEIKKEQLPALTEKISIFFEACFLLQKNLDGLHCVTDSFYYTERIKCDTKLKLPNGKICSILKTEANPLLKKMNLGIIDKNSKMQAYLMHLSDKTALIVFSQSAEPWARLKIEKLQETFYKINFLI